MRTKTLQADVLAPNNYPLEFITRDLVVQIFTQIEPYITFEEANKNSVEKIYRARLKIILNDKGDC